MKKKLSILLAVLMLFTVFAGCTGCTKSTTAATTAATTAVTTAATSAGTTKSTTAATTAATTKATEPTKVNLASQYPITDKLISMKLAVSVAGSEKPENMWFFEWYEKKTNIHWDFITIPSTSWNEKKTVMLATGDYPDVFFGQSFSAAEMQKYGKQGIFIPLNNLITKYGDTIKKMVDQQPAAWAAATCPDGNIYGLPSIVLSVSTTTMTYVRPYVNQKWMNKVGVVRPVTLDDYYQLLIKFRDNDLDGDGDTKDEIPFTGTWNVVTYNPRSMFLNAYGYATNGALNNNIAVFKGETVYMPLTSRYKEYLVYMNKLFTEGLMDPDLFTQDATQINAKGNLGRIGSIQCTQGHPFTFDPVNYEDYTAIALAYDKDSKPVIYQNEMYAIGKYEITDKCKYPEAAMRWANMFYLPEVGYNMVYGPETGSAEDTKGIGSITNVNAAGEFVSFTYPKWDAQKMTLWEFYASEKPINSNFGFGMDSSYNLDLLKKGRAKTYEESVLWHQGMLLTDNLASRPNVWGRYSVLMNLTKNITFGYPTVYLSDTDQKYIDEYKTPLEDYVSNMEAKFITGAIPIASKYDEFIAEIKKLGAEKYLDIYAKSKKG